MYCLSTLQIGSQVLAGRDIIPYGILSRCGFAIARHLGVAQIMKLNNAIDGLKARDLLYFYLPTCPQRIEN